MSNWNLHLTLILSSLFSSKLFYFLINDPEGPNLLIVLALAMILYFMAIGGYLKITKIQSKIRVKLLIVVQIIVVLIASLLLK